jgi:hypothetical protein
MMMARYKEFNLMLHKIKMLSMHRLDAQERSFRF